MKIDLYLNQSMKIKLVNDIIEFDHVIFHGKGVESDLESKVFFIFIILVK